MSAVTIDMTVVVTQKNLAVCWKPRVSDSTRKSKNLFSADNQQETNLYFEIWEVKSLAPLAYGPERGKVCPSRAMDEQDSALHRTG